jgi:hypothetical protein
MISVEQIITRLHNAKAAYIVTVEQDGGVTAVLIGEKSDEDNAAHIINALDVILDSEMEYQDTPQVLSGFLGLVAVDDINLN